MIHEIDKNYLSGTAIRHLKEANFEKLKCLFLGKYRVM